jgi:hypothetical protein
MMTEQEAYALGERIACDLPLAEEVSLVRDEWTGTYGVYIHVNHHEALILEPQEWPTQVFISWLADDVARREGKL